MKKHFLLFVSLILLAISCKTDKKQKEERPEKELTVLEKVANAHGYDNWKDISTIKFTFNVDRDSSHFERSWLWKPKSNDVVLMTRKDTVNYNRKVMDTVIIKTDGGFINDKFWLLAPYQLIWDRKGFTFEHSENEEAPISKKKMHKLTTVYASEGGYTPGDAYDYYFGDDYVIQEWVFRKANQEEPSMVTSWEEYKTLEGLAIATMHKRPDADFQLYFTGVEVE